jgi:hypothetical protein
MNNDTIAIAELEALHTPGSHHAVNASPWSRNTLSNEGSAALAKPRPSTVCVHPTVDSRPEKFQMDDEGIVTSGGDSLAIDAMLYGLGKLYGAYAATRSR